MIAGLLQPTSGDIAFDGRSILRDKPEQRGVVMVFQNHLLFPYMSVADNIGFGLKMRKVPRPEIEARVARDAGAWCNCPIWAAAARPNCQAASNSAWRWPGR